MRVAGILFLATGLCFSQGQSSKAIDILDDTLLDSTVSETADSIKNLVPAAEAPVVSSEKKAPSVLSKIAVPVTLPPPAIGCLSCSPINVYDPGCAATFLIGKNSTLPPGNLLAYASNLLWLVKKTTRIGDIGVAGGPALDAGFIYKLYDMRPWEQRVSDSLGMHSLGFYSPFSDGG